MDIGSSLHSGCSGVAPSGNDLPRGKRRQILNLLLRSDTFSFCSPLIGQSKSDDMTDLREAGRKYIPPTGAGRRIGILVNRPKSRNLVTAVSDNWKESEGLHPETLFAKQTTFTFMFLWTFLKKNWLNRRRNIKGEVLAVTSYLVVPSVCSFRKCM